MCFQSTDVNALCLYACYVSSLYLMYSGCGRVAKPLIITPAMGWFGIKVIASSLGV